ncbi:MAG: proton-conducting transporter membrane subunit [Zavarzinia sp.]|nr:proton-conducting transporter membrane subunit [Zavarzinia sp.]
MTEALAFDFAALPAGWPLLLAGAFAAALSLPIAARNVGWLGLIASLYFLFIDGSAPALAPLDGALALAFHLVAAAGLLFAATMPDRTAVACGLIATGAGTAAIAGTSLPSLMIWTEVIAIASALIIMAGGTMEAIRAGLAYLLLQVLAGVLLLIAIVYGAGTETAAVLILIGLGIKAALPPAHGWLIHGYPAATPTGSLFLSAFATKIAILGMVRFLPGTEALVWIGLAMAVGGVIPTLFESNWRRLLAWALVSQLGVMVIGVGLGDEAALAGVRMLAIGHVIYATMLFLVAGVLERAGGTAPRGLLLLTLAATVSIGVPGLAGYGGKAVIGEALIHHGMGWADIVIVVVGAIVFATAGLRPIMDRCRVTGGHTVVGRDTVATLILLAGGVGIGAFGGLLSPHAEAAFHGEPLIIQGVALLAVIVFMTTRLRHLLPQRDNALGFLAVPWPRWVTGAVDLGIPVGNVLVRLGEEFATLLGQGGRFGGRAVLGLARFVTYGGVGDGVLWTVALLTLVLIVSFG